MTAQTLDALAVGETATFELELTDPEGGHVDVSALLGDAVQFTMRRFAWQERGVEDFFSAVLGDGLTIGKAAGDDDGPATVLLTIPGAASALFIAQECHWSVWARWSNVEFPVAYGTLPVVRI